MTSSDGRDYWNSEVGQTWARMDEVLAATHAPVTDLLLSRAAISTGERVLDIGCGAGQSTRRAALACGPSGSVTGADLSRAMLDRARMRGVVAGAAPIRYLERDVEADAFPPASFDLVLSQFGVMFFEDSAAAFARIRACVAPAGRIVFVAWAAADENPWFCLPRAVAVAELGPVESNDDAPGPMAFRDRGRVEGYLRAAGWQDVASAAVGLELTPPGTRAEVAWQATTMGPAARVARVHDADDAARGRIAAGIAERFADYERDGAVFVPARVNLFSAVASA